MEPEGKLETGYAKRMAANRRILMRALELRNELVLDAATDGVRRSVIATATGLSVMHVGRLINYPGAPHPAEVESVGPEVTVVDQSVPQVSFDVNGHTFAVGTKVEFVGHELTGRIIATHRGTIVVGLVHGPVMQLQLEHFKLLDVRPL